MKSDKQSLIAPLVSLALGLSAVIPLVLSFFDKMGEVPLLGLNAGIWTGICCAIILKMLSKKYALIAAYPPLLFGALLVLKPKFAPVMHSYDGLHPFSYTSETHLYFVLPGIIIIIVSFLFLLMKKDVTDKNNK